MFTVIVYQTTSTWEPGEDFPEEETEQLENKTFEDLDELLDFARTNFAYPSSSPIDLDSWYQSTPEQDREYFEHGIEKVCSYHLAADIPKEIRQKLIAALNQNGIR
jgi:hypothetical protein